MQPSIPPLLRALEHDQSCIVAGADEGLPDETLFLTNDATIRLLEMAWVMKLLVNQAFRARLPLTSAPDFCPECCKARKREAP